MTNQHRLPFQDPELVTRRPALNVVHAHVESVADFNESYFAGYNVFRALTYTSSIPMVANLLRQHDFDDFECIFGHNGILSREAEEILAFQAVVREKLATGLLGLKRVSAERPNSSTTESPKAPLTRSILRRQRCVPCLKRISRPERPCLTGVPR